VQQQARPADSQGTHGCHPTNSHVTHGALHGRHSASTAKRLRGWLVALATRCLGQRGPSNGLGSTHKKGRRGTWRGRMQTGYPANLHDQPTVSQPIRVHWRRGKLQQLRAGVLLAPKGQQVRILLAIPAAKTPKFSRVQALTFPQTSQDTKTPPPLPQRIHPPVRLLLHGLAQEPEGFGGSWGHHLPFWSHLPRAKQV
jgi:hypothetical protein